MADPVVEVLGEVWQEIDELCSGFTEADWKAPTECPGWSVQDNLSHLVGSESTFMGHPMPDHEVTGDQSHVRNEMGRRNEVIVDYRRSWPGEKVLAEFREVTRERLAQLRAMTEQELSAESWTPAGMGTLRDLLAIRAFDAWTHEQDMRRAVGRPGNLEGPGARHSIGRCLMAMPFVVGKKAGAPDGSTVVFDVAGAAGGTYAVGVGAGRAKRLDDVPGDPTVRLSMPVEAFTRLGCGRWDPEQAVREGQVRIDGDRELGERILREINFMI